VGFTKTHNALRKTSSWVCIVEESKYTTARLKDLVGKVSDALQIKSVEQNRCLLTEVPIALGINEKRLPVNILAIPQQENATV
jgi:hypothetical protein